MTVGLQMLYLLHNFRGGRYAGSEGTDRPFSEKMRELGKVNEISRLHILLAAFPGWGSVQGPYDCPPVQNAPAKP